ILKIKWMVWIALEQLKAVDLQLIVVIVTDKNVGGHGRFTFLRFLGYAKDRLRPIRLRVLRRVSAAIRCSRQRIARCYPRFPRDPLRRTCARWRHGQSFALQPCGGLSRLSEVCCRAVR